MGEPSTDYSLRTASGASAHRSLSLASSRARDCNPQLCEEEASQPFDLSTGPLVRVRLLRLAKLPEEEHVLLLSMHHIISDGWSIGLLIRELATLYEAYAAGTERAEGAEPPIWRLCSLAAEVAAGGEVLDRQLAYWREDNSAMRRPSWSYRWISSAPQRQAFRARRSVATCRKKSAKSWRR